MKRTLLFTLTLLGMIFSVNAQTITFEETFESLTEPDLPLGWDSVDRKFDPTDSMAVALTWVGYDAAIITDPIGFSGKTTVMSSSQNTDALLISPEINLQVGNTYSLSFLIGTYSPQSFGGGINHYAVYVLSAANTFTGTETPVLEEDFSTGNIAMQKNVDLSGFAGQNIRVYFRQFNGPFLSLLLVDNVRITQQSTLGISEVVSNKSMGIYPNPASDYVYLKSTSKISKAEIFDVTGRKIKAVVNDNKVDLKNLPSGTYIINITSGNKIYSQKVIKK